MCRRWGGGESGADVSGEAVLCVREQERAEDAPVCSKMLFHVAPPSVVSNRDALGPLAMNPWLASRKKMSSCLAPPPTVGAAGILTQLAALTASS